MQIHGQDIKTNKTSRESVCKADSEFLNISNKQQLNKINFFQDQFYL